MEVNLLGCNLMSNLALLLLGGCNKMIESVTTIAFDLLFFLLNYILYLEWLLFMSVGPLLEGSV